MLTRRGLLGSLALGALALGSCRMNESNDTKQESAPQVLIGGVDWYVDYDAAVAIAREQDKALWVHFGENPG